jgi:hypothetical protein
MLMGSPAAYMMIDGSVLAAIFVAKEVREARTLPSRHSGKILGSDLGSDFHALPSNP